jgi:serine phosphatase RsbU (regulator of sigma subunit)/ligand-binding sensor domain-containing protein
MPKHLLTILITFLTIYSWSQDYYPPIVNYAPKDYKVNKINEDDGSPYKMGPENFAIVQDQRGVMYFGNSNGVLEYDGENWDFIKVVIGSYVRALNKDEKGTIYVGTYNNFGYLKANTKGELIYESLSNLLPEEDQFFSDILAIHCNPINVFFQAQEALYIYNIKNHTLETVYPETSFHTSYMVNHKLYVREREKGLMVYENHQLKLLKGTQKVFGTYGCFGIYQSNYSNALFIITQEQGLFYYQNDSLIPILDPNQNHINPLSVFNSIKLSDNNYALSTFTTGVYIINEKGTILKQINKLTGLRSDDIKAMYEDKEQNLWLGLGNGIAKVNYYSPLSFFNEKSGIEGDVQAFIRYNGLLYVGTSNGLFVQDLAPNRLNEFVNISPIKNQIWDFEIYNNKLFIASTEGVFDYHSKTNQYRKLTHFNTNKILFLPSHNLFVTAGSGGVYLWSKDFHKIKTFPRNLTTILSIEQDPNHQNIVWIGTAHSGAIRLKLDNNQYVLDQYDNLDGIWDDLLIKPLQLNHQIVFGSSYGLLSFVDEEEVKKGLDEELKDDPDFYRGFFENTTFYDSAFVAEILLISEDTDRTWFTADHKIGYYDKMNNTFVNRPFWGINYGRVNQFYLEPNHVLWIGCADGVIRFKENQQKNYNASFKALIRSVTINNDSILYLGAELPDTIEPPVINYKFNDIKFRYSAPYFEDEHKPLYSYKLEGKDQNWSDWTTNNNANYTNLHEGNYVFKVKAKNIYNQESDVATYHFSILPPWYRTMWAYIIYFILFILLLVIAVKISSHRLKVKNLQLEEIVKERTKEISEKNTILEHKNEMILEQKKEIEDSINYAKRIQDAILPLKTEMKKHLPKSFVLYKPKDIVSGDFYWFSKKGNQLIVVCADCTGHGVPGAFMSMIGSDRLNIIVNERHETRPGQILSNLNKAIKNTLKQEGNKQESTKDGMDAAICTINLDTNQLVYAGANRPLWVVDHNEIEEIKATKVAVAGFTSDEQVYEEHIIEQIIGKKFYMTTDGYADQFGGPKGKKYKVKALKNYILNICNLPYNEQENLLNHEIINWMHASKEEIEQVDDICIIGFEL